MSVTDAGPPASLGGSGAASLSLAPATGASDVLTALPEHESYNRSCFDVMKLAFPRLAHSQLLRLDAESFVMPFVMPVIAKTASLESFQSDVAAMGKYDMANATAPVLQSTAAAPGPDWRKEAGALGLVPGVPAPAPAALPTRGNGPAPEPRFGQYGNINFTQDSTGVAQESE